MRYDTDDFTSPDTPEVTILTAGKESRDRYGHRFGSQVLYLTSEQLAALQHGQQLAVNIMSGEYVLFLNGPQ